MDLCGPAILPLPLAAQEAWMSIKALDRSAGRVFSNLFVAFYIVRNRRARLTSALARHDQGNTHDRAIDSAGE
jgi:hypothetical protein